MSWSLFVLCIFSHERTLNCESVENLFQRKVHYVMKSSNKVKVKVNNLVDDSFIQNHFTLALCAGTWPAVHEVTFMTPPTDALSQFNGKACEMCKGNTFLSRRHVHLLVLVQRSYHHPMIGAERSLGIRRCCFLSSVAWFAIPQSPAGTAPRSLIYAPSTVRTNAKACIAYFKHEPMIAHVMNTNCRASLDPSIRWNDIIS